MLFHDKQVHTGLQAPGNSMHVDYFAYGVKYATESQII